MNHKQAREKQAKDYRGLAERVREAAYRDSNERQRAELLARAKIWDFLADHFPHRPALLAIGVRWKDSRSRFASP
jgi:hypothetical protein